MKAYRLIHHVTHAITNSQSVIFDEITSSLQDHGGNSQRQPMPHPGDNVDPVIESDISKSIEIDQSDTESESHNPLFEPDSLVDP